MATKITDVRQYWQSSPKRQIRTLQILNKQELEAYADENELVIYRGKAVRPEDYPCKCLMESPYDCYQEKHRAHTFTESLDKMCKCRCHTYWMPD